jgi:hypothetical protein
MRANSRILLVCTRVLLVFYSYVLIFYWYLLVCYSCVIRMYVYVTRVLLVCYWHVLVCTRMLLVCTRMYLWVTRMLLVWCFSHDHLTIVKLLHGLLSARQTKNQIPILDVIFKWLNYQINTFGMTTLKITLENH